MGTSKIKNTAIWMGAHVLGNCLALPGLVYLAVRFLISPRTALRPKDRTKLQLPEAVPGMKHEFFTVNGVKIHAARSASGRGKPLLLFVHGFPQGWWAWHHQIKAFQKDYDVVAVDQRGYGESDKPKGRREYHMDRLVADLVGVAEALLEKTGEKKIAALVGHDWGGNVCWQAAHLRPELFSRLAVLCVPHPNCDFVNMDWDQFKRSWYVFSFLAPWVPEAFYRCDDWNALTLMLTSEAQRPRQSPFSEEDVERHKQNMARPGSITACLNYYRGLLDVRLRDATPAHLRSALGRKLTVPTLLLWADSDPVMGPQVLKGTENHVEDLQIQMLANCSHWAQHDAAAEVNSQLEAFLNKPTSV